MVSYEIFESVIRTTERMTYKNVNKIYDGDPETTEKYLHIKDMLFEMKKLQEILWNRRAARGSIEFEFPETKITLDDKGFPVDIRPYERGISERVIEEFMLICNETVAEDMFWKELPFVYRVHETPDPEKIQKFADFIHNFDLRMAGSTEDLHPKAVQQMMELIKGRREERLISTMMLRSLKKARYTPDCLGHFGLAAKYYCHFTSPIRRYPDLQIHRIIKENIHGKLNEKRIKHYESILGDVSFHSSDRERVADEAEREVDDMKKAEYMSRHVGEEFEGIITSVAGFGFYVELPSTIEGLVHVTSLMDDYYEFDEANHLLRGERRNLCFRIGDEVRVRVDKADVAARKIDFSVVEKLSSSVGNMEMSEGEATNVSDYQIKPRRRATVSGKEALRNVRDKAKGEYSSRSRSKKAQDKIGGTFEPAEKYWADSDKGSPFAKKDKEKKKKMGFSEYVKTEDPSLSSKKTEKGNPKPQGRRFDREADEPYAGYNQEKNRETGEYEERVTGVDKRHQKKLEFIEKSIAAKERGGKSSSHRKGQGRPKTEGGWEDRGSKEPRRSYQDKGSGPADHTNAEGQKTTNYYLEKYGHLKPSSSPSKGKGNNGSGKGAGGGKSGGYGKNSGGGKGGSKGGGKGGSGAGKSANKAGYEKRKGK